MNIYYLFIDVFGCKTSKKLEWRSKIKLYSLYSVSSLLFGVIGLIAYTQSIISNMECAVLIMISTTSYLSDVIYIGVPHYIRCIDTILATSIIFYYMLSALFEYSNKSIISIFITCIGLIYFKQSIKSQKFEEMRYYHTMWHLIIQLGLCIYLL